MKELEAGPTIRGVNNWNWVWGVYSYYNHNQEPQDPILIIKALTLYVLLQGFGAFRGFQVMLH